jgi:hypothetical protein
MFDMIDQCILIGRTVGYSAALRPEPKAFDFRSESPKSGVGVDLFESFERGFDPREQEAASGDIERLRWRNHQQHGDCANYHWFDQYIPLESHASRAGHLRLFCAMSQRKHSHR